MAISRDAGPAAETPGRDMAGGDGLSGVITTAGGGGSTIPFGGSTGAGATAGGGGARVRLAGGRGAQENPASASVRMTPTRNGQAQAGSFGEGRGGMTI